MSVGFTAREREGHFEKPTVLLCPQMCDKHMASTQKNSTTNIEALDVCQCTSPVNAYMNKLRAQLSKEQKAAAHKLVETSKQELNNWLGQEKLEVLDKFVKQRELERLSDKLASEMPDVPRDYFRHGLHYMLNGVQQRVEQQVRCLRTAQKKAQLAKQQAKQQETIDTSSSDDSSADTTIVEVSETDSKATKPPQKSKPPVVVTASPTVVQNHDSSGAASATPTPAQSDGPPDHALTDASTQTEPCAAYKYCVSWCLHGGEQSTKPLTRCGLCMKWFHVTCCEDPEDVKFCKGAWTCPVCREMPCKVNRIQDTLEAVMALLQTFSQETASDSGASDSDSDSGPESDAESGPEPDPESEAEPEPDADSEAEVSDSEDKANDSTIPPHVYATATVEAPQGSGNQTTQGPNSAEHDCADSEEEAVKSPPFQQQRAQKRKARKKHKLQERSETKYSARILCDSIPKNIDRDYIARKTSTKVTLIRAGYTISQVVDYVQNEDIETSTPLLIHTGTNHVEPEKIHRILDRLDRLEYNLQRRGYKNVLMSSVVHRNSNRDTFKSVDKVNTRIALICAKNHWTFIDNDNLDETCLSSDGIHLNGIGDERFTTNICKGLKAAIH